MYERIKRLYEEGKLDVEGVWNAVLKGMITEQEFVNITHHDPLDFKNQEENE